MSKVPLRCFYIHARVERVLVMTADGSFEYKSGTSISIVQMWAKAGLLQSCYHDQTGLWWEDERLYAEMKARAVDLGDEGWDEETGWGVVIGTPTAYETPESNTGNEETALSNMINNEFDFVVDAGLAWAGTLSKLDRLDAIVIHHSASDGSTIQSIHKYHLSEGHKGCDYNYVIETDGTIYRGRGLLYEGGHVGNAKSNCLNAHSCGICLVGAIHKHEPTAAQVASAKKLITAILSLNGQTINGVAIQVNTIYGHREVPYYVNGKLTGDPYPTVCPGAYMPMDEFKALLTGGAVEEDVEEGVPYLYAGASYVNIRTGPGTGYSILGQLRAGEQCRVLSFSGGWAQIKKGDVTGWCIDTYLKKV